MSDLEAIRFLGLKKLLKIRANNYIRLTKPFTRFDPEMIDREIRKRRIKGK